MKGFNYLLDQSVEKDRKYEHFHAFLAQKPG